MDLALRHFWLIILVFVVGGNLLLSRPRLAKLVAMGRITAAECATVQRAYALVIGVPILAWGVYTEVIGAPSPFCAMPFVVRSPVSAATFAVYAATMIALLLWIWRGSGAELLAKVAPALSRWPKYDRTYEPRTVRLGATALVAFSVVGFIAASQSVLKTPPPECRAWLQSRSSAPHDVP